MNFARQRILKPSRHKINEITIIVLPLFMFLFFFITAYMIQYLPSQDILFVLNGCIFVLNRYFICLKCISYCQNWILFFLLMDVVFGCTACWNCLSLTKYLSYPDIVFSKSSLFFSYICFSHKYNSFSRRIIVYYFSFCL